jgi:glycosyltransferase involved in cell wall biosynthesis
LSKIKILQLRSSIGFFGAENVVIELARQLSRKNYHPIIGVIENSKEPHTELIDVAKRYNLETKIFKCTGQFDLRTVIAIRNYVKKQHIDIVHSHGYKADFFAVLATLFRNMHLFATCHPWIRTNLMVKLYARFDKYLLKKFDRIVAISDEIKHEILMSGISEDKVTAINNGIDFSRFKYTHKPIEFLKEFKIDPDKIIIGTIGRLSEEKGQMIFIKAAKKLLENIPNLLFMIVGDGPLREKLQTNVINCGIRDHFIFTGVSDDIPKILAILDIFVLPSLTEGLPMVLLEAMAAKKPIIATAVGAIPNVIIDKESGHLIKPGDTNGLIDAIMRLFNDQDYTSRIAQKGFEIAIKEYSSEEMAKNYERIYEQL